MVPLLLCLSVSPCGHRFVLQHDLVYGQSSHKPSPNCQILAWNHVGNFSWTSNRGNIALFFESMCENAVFHAILRKEQHVVLLVAMNTVLPLTGVAVVTQELWIQDGPAVVTRGF